MLPVWLISLASCSARWSAHRITFLSLPTPKPPSGVTSTGRPSWSVTAREQVASKPMPFTWLASIFLVTSRTADEMHDQIWSVDCSKMRASASLRNVVVACVDSERMLPVSSTSAARALPVPLRGESRGQHAPDPVRTPSRKTHTSTPTKKGPACVIFSMCMMVFLPRRTGSFPSQNPQICKGSLPPLARFDANSGANSRGFLHLAIFRRRWRHPWLLLLAPTAIGSRYRRTQVRSVRAQS